MHLSTEILLMSHTHCAPATSWPRIARRTRRVGLALLLALAAASTSFAQNRPTPAPPQVRRAAAVTRAPGKWTVEVHGGVFGDAIGNGLSASDALTPFPAGAAFTTVNGLPSRAVTSWAFGDGNALFDQVRGAFASSYGVALPGIVPLDSVMQSRGIARQPAAAFGGRFSRNLTSWLAAELAFDRGPLRSSLSSGAADGLEATRASYATAWQALLATVPQTGARVSSVVVAPDEASNSQTVIAGNALLSFVRTSRVGVHAVIGGGLIVNDASDVEARLQSSYQFAVFSAFPINESESVTIRFSEKKRVPAAVLGLGATILATGNSGVRVEGRVLASRSSATTTISASASQLRGPQSLALPSITTPSIQFSSVASIRTSLSGDAIADVVTLDSTRIDLTPQVTIGYFFRF